MVLGNKLAKWKKNILSNLFISEAKDDVVLSNFSHKPILVCCSSNRILKVTQNMIQAEHIFIYKLSRVSPHATCSARENSFHLTLKRNYLSVTARQGLMAGRGLGGVGDGARQERGLWLLFIRKHKMVFLIASVRSLHCKGHFYLIFCIL